MPTWPFGMRRPTDDVPSPTSPLDQIDQVTRHRFRIWLEDAADGEAALGELRGRMPDEVRAEASAEPDGRARLDLASTFSPRTAAILRPLHVLKRAGVDAHGFEAIDLVTGVDDRSVARAVEAWGQFGNNGPHRRRLEALAGDALLETCMARLRRAGTGHDRPAVWRFAVGCVAFNTPGAEGRMLSEAASSSHEDAALSFIDAASNRATLAGLTHQFLAIPEQAAATLIRRSGYVSERASHLAALMPGPLPEAVTAALLQVAGEGGERGASATGALQNAEPSESVRQALEEAMAAADDPNLQAAALATFAHHWGAQARPIWREFLTSRSAPLRWTAEAVLGTYGTQEDLTDAAAQLRTLARTKSSVGMSPPRGHEIVDLLARHRDDPDARGGLDDLSARWVRLGNDLREWLAEHHPWLDPRRRSDQPAEQDGEPEPELLWPAPAIERDGDELKLWFDESAAHMSSARWRFEELAGDHPLVEVLDGDREWLSVRIRDAEPEMLVKQLWEAAGPSA
jgi:hypothetical protein